MTQNNRKNQTAYLIIDTEAVPNGELIKRVKYPDLAITAEEAVDRAMAEQRAESPKGSDFVNVGFQMPVCIAVARLNPDLELLALGGECYQNESGAATAFWKVINATDPQLAAGPEAKGYPGARLITFNGRGFDLPLMEEAAYRYGIQSKFYWDQRYGHRYRYGNLHIDLHEFFTNFGACRMAGGLDMHAKSVGAPGKSGTCGGDVLRLWRDGEFPRIAAYCMRDVLDTYLVFLRTRVIVGDIDMAKEAEIRHSLAEWLKKEGEGRKVFAEYLQDWRGK